LRVPGVVPRGGDEGTMISFKVIGRGKRGVSDFGEEQRLFSSKVHCVMVREIDVPWDPEKGA